MLDIGKLGFDSYYIFIQLTGLNSKQEKETYQSILKLPYVAWLVTGVGRWDAVILICARAINEFNLGLDNLKNLLGSHLHEFTFTTLIQAEHISYKFLRQESESLKTTPRSQKLFLDEKDLKILATLNQSARMPITELAEKTGFSVTVAHYRLKQMKKQKIIQGFRPKINVQKMGLQWQLLLIAFNPAPKERIRIFMEYCRQHKNVYYITNTVGRYNIMLDVHVKSTEEFREFLFDLKNNFQDLILLYESVLVFEELIITYIPSIICNEQYQIKQ
jgi:DNA-binding Lrp family transcriptional regulator